MKKHIILYLVILITVVNLSALATILYLHWRPSYSNWPPSGFELLKRETKLTVSQIEQFAVYRQLFHTELDSLEQLMINERRKLANEIRKPEPDDECIEQSIKRIGQLQQKSQYEVIDHFFRIKKILTPEQQYIFFNIVLERFISQQQFPGNRYSEQQAEK